VPSLVATGLDLPATALQVVFCLCQLLADMLGVIKQRLIEIFQLAAAPGFVVGVAQASLLQQVLRYSSGWYSP
jgi:hypothetical protein